MKGRKTLEQENAHTQINNGPKISGEKNNKLSLHSLQRKKSLIALLKSPDKTFSGKIIKDWH